MTDLNLFILCYRYIKHTRFVLCNFKFAGRIRDYNITKKEWVLRGDAVFYVSAPDIRRAIEYDLEQEKAFDYTGLNIDEIVRHITRFNIYPDKPRQKYLLTVKGLVITEFVIIIIYIS